MGKGWSAFLEIMIYLFILFFHDSCLNYYLCADRRMLYYLLLFTYVSRWFYLLKVFFDSILTNNLFNKEEKGIEVM